MITFWVLVIAVIVIAVTWFCYFKGEKIYDKTTDFVNTFVEELEEERIEEFDE